MRLNLVVAGVLVAGCGSSWDIRKGDSLDVGCAESFFYADADGDGWGDPTSERQPLCAPDIAAGLTASNGRDCDDGSTDITGNVGSMCPDGLVGSFDGGPVPHGGLVFDVFDFAYVFGAESPVARNGMAIQACIGWGGSELVDGSAVDRGTLATFGSQAELEEVRDALEADLSGSVYAGFIGVEWDGVAMDAGAWSWVDDSDDALLTSAFSWCGDVEPVPTDFFPNLNPADPDHVPAINGQLPELRLAMVLPENGEWCLGLPLHAIPQTIWDDMQAGNANYADPLVADVSRYNTMDAHLVCKRASPNPDDYRHLVGAEE